MRTDLLIAMTLGGVAAFLAVAGFALFDWSPIVVGLLFAVMVAADGYFVLGHHPPEQGNPRRSGSCGGPQITPCSLTSDPHFPINPPTAGPCGPDVF